MHVAVYDSVTYGCQLVKKSKFMQKCINYYVTSPDGIIMLRIQTSLSPARPPGARGLEKYDISDYCGGQQCHIVKHVKRNNFSYNPIACLAAFFVHQLSLKNVNANLFISLIFSTYCARM